MGRLAYVLADTITSGDGTIARTIPKGCYAVSVLNGTGNPHFQFGPRLRAALWDDNGTFEDQTSGVGERGTTTSFDINAFAGGDDAYYIGSDLPFRGFFIDLANTNDTASVLTVNYWDGTQWADTSATDGTDVAGDTLKQDGDVFFTTPTDWTKRTVNSLGPYFWVQAVVDNTLDASVSINEISLLNVHGAEDMTVGPAATASVENMPLEIDQEAVGSVECTGDAASEAIVVWYYCQRADGGFVANV